MKIDLSVWNGTYYRIHRNMVKVCKLKIDKIIYFCIGYFKWISSLSVLVKNYYLSEHIIFDFPPDKNCIAYFHRTVYTPHYRGHETWYARLMVLKKERKKKKKLFDIAQER